MLGYIWDNVSIINFGVCFVLFCSVPFCLVTMMATAVEERGERGLDISIIHVVTINVHASANPNHNYEIGR